MLQNDQEIADNLNSFFGNAVSDLEKKNGNPFIINPVLDDVLDPVANVS